MEQLTPDHVIPMSKGGDSLGYNIQPLCYEHNRIKSIKTTDYRPYAKQRMNIQPRFGFCGAFNFVNSPSSTLPISRKALYELTPIA
jgi:hypothetical protein